MITAKEAKDLYDQSGAEVDDYIKYKLESEIRTAATSGKRQWFHLIGSNQKGFNPIQPTPLQNRIISKLTELGFSARWIDSHGTAYVPRGLADLEGNGPLHTNYGILIGW